MVQLFEPEGLGAADSNITDGAEFNEEAPATRTDTTAVTFKSSGGDSDVVEGTWVSPSLSNADMPSGVYRGGVEVGAIGAEQSYKVQLRRYNAAGSSQEILGTSSSQNTTGPFIFAPTVDPGVGTSTDRIAMVILGSRGASHGNQTWSCTVNDVDTLLEVPFDAPAGGFTHSSIPGIIG